MVTFLQLTEWQKGVGEIRESHHEKATPPCKRNLRGGVILFQMIGNLTISISIKRRFSPFLFPYHGKNASFYFHKSGCSVPLLRVIRLRDKNKFPRIIL